MLPVFFFRDVSQLNFIMIPFISVKIARFFNFFSLFNKITFKFDSDSESSRHFL